MLGIRYTRTLLGYKGEEFADLLGTNKSTLSLWESGKRRIPEEKKREIWNLFGCPVELLDLELSLEEKTKVYQLICEKGLINDSYNIRIEENKNKEFNDFINRLYITIQSEPEIFEILKRVYDLCQKPNGKAAVNLLVLAARQYYKITTACDYVTTDNEKEDRINGKFYKNDPVLVTIFNMLQIAFPKENE